MSELASFWDFGWGRVIIWKIVRPSGKFKSSILDISYSSSEEKHFPLSIASIVTTASNCHCCETICL